MLLDLRDFKVKLFKRVDSIPEILNKGYYPSIDGLRGISILSVIFRHFSLNESWGVWIDGTIGIHIFFIISGFLITTLLLKEKISKGCVSLKNFYIRRTLRIFPVAYLYILTLIVLSNIFDFSLSSKSILTSIFYLKNFPIASEWYTGHFWSLSVEEQFYLAAPIVLITSTNKYIRILLALFILVPIIDYVGFHNIGIFYSVRWVHVLTFLFLALFNQGTLYILLGSLFSILIFKKIIIVNKNSSYYLSAVLFLIAVFIHFSYLSGSVPYLSSTIFAVLIAFVIVLNLTENNLLTWILSNPLLVKLGILSYSLYIWQQVFTSDQPWKKAFIYSDSILFNLFALLITAYCSYHFYEVKFLALKKRFK
ncbi:acyltransferase [Mucilaginibacter sp. L3T2-6]|uniref:acyltransferase family protein n=1 Tax=Mucilaginibacter sp. L3T2-6 TaxID=3062491 RepID=UPI0026765915|nr:acyltransferase [Mucilaginibacter sp. L3T2-6]MDO3644719.1 acyltransferase [Mucilaginibacter sp. L3T2-6]MDV6217171.1 acyltransferase [Mucilaginibacter sp. L3T2-6]